ncbi:MAG TPA: nucleoside phosphorylase [Thermoanaerobacterales bacterium]|nr:nucleoside phosphorylase [Thermoanaerobacterales bacterium]
MEKQIGKKEPPLFEVDGKAVLTGLTKGDKLGRYAILAVRDPLGFSKDAADVIADYMTDVKEVARNSMFTVLSGNYRNAQILVCSTGSGGADTEIALMDLMQYGGVDTFLRIGTSGTQQPDLNVGDIVITEGAVRDEGLTKEYIAPQYPAIANYEMMISMIEVAQRKGLRYHVGITRSNDSIYCGQGRTVQDYLPMPQDRIVEYWVNAGILNVERETSTILTLAKLFKARGGSICVVCNSSISQEVGVSQGIDDAILVGLEGLAILARRDIEKEKAGQKWWSPYLSSDEN